MDQAILELAAGLVDKLHQTPPESRLIIGIAGSPAAGKSSFCHRLLKHVNLLLQCGAEANSPDGDLAAILVGLDGWHLTRAELSLFPDPKSAHERRGIHWTFDGPGYVTFVQSLRFPLSTPAAPSDIKVIMAPTFSHAIKDPTPDAISIHPHHRLVVIEGLYTCLSVPPWSAASALLDERWFLRVDEDEARRRLMKRHVETGICATEDEARLRADENDLPNGRFVSENMLQPIKFFDSIEDSGLAAELE
ncbi:P-loop containing nucleoside triphosphate hydrolase protein [Mycena rebaudengoi]|nr:P-loop containing nucleoside triphosphate hydrolase protein [Mycena rebaudengoi]